MATSSIFPDPTNVAIPLTAFSFIPPGTTVSISEPGSLTHRITIENTRGTPSLVINFGKLTREEIDRAILPLNVSVDRHSSRLIHLVFKQLLIVNPILRPPWERHLQQKMKAEIEAKLSSLTNIPPWALESIFDRANSLEVLLSDLITIVQTIAQSQLRKKMLSLTEDSILHVSWKGKILPVTQEQTGLTRRIIRIPIGEFSLDELVKDEIPLTVRIRIVNRFTPDEDVDIGPFIIPYHQLLRLSQIFKSRLAIVITIKHRELMQRKKELEELISSTTPFHFLSVPPGADISSLQMCCYQEGKAIAATTQQQIGDAFASLSSLTKKTSFDPVKDITPLAYLQQMVQHLDLMRKRAVLSIFHHLMKEYPSREQPPLAIPKEKLRDLRETIHSLKGYREIEQTDSLVIFTFSLEEYTTPTELLAALDGNSLIKHLLLPKIPPFAEMLSLTIPSATPPMHPSLSPTQKITAIHDQPTAIAQPRIKTLMRPNRLDGFPVYYTLFVQRLSPLEVITGRIEKLTFFTQNVKGKTIHTISAALDCSHMEYVDHEGEIGPTESTHLQCSIPFPRLSEGQKPFTLSLENLRAQLRLDITTTIHSLHDNRRHHLLQIKGANLEISPQFLTLEEIQSGKIGSIALITKFDGREERSLITIDINGCPEIEATRKTLPNDFGSNWKKTYLQRAIGSLLHRRTFERDLSFISQTSIQSLHELSLTLQNVFQSILAFSKELLVAKKRLVQDLHSNENRVFLSMSSTRDFACKPDGINTNATLTISSGANVEKIKIHEYVIETARQRNPGMTFCKKETENAPNASNAYQIENVDPAIVRHVLDFFYTNQIQIPPLDLVAVLEFAQKHKIKQLEDLFTPEPLLEDFAKLLRLKQELPPLPTLSSLELPLFSSRADLPEDFIGKFEQFIAATNAFVAKLPTYTAQKS